VVPFGMTLHDGRHWCGTRLVEAGVDIRTVSEILGHADPAFTLRTYAHTDDDRKRAAATALGALGVSFGDRAGRGRALGIAGYGWPCSPGSQPARSRTIAARRRGKFNTMTIRDAAPLGDWAGPLWLTVGWTATFFPAIYMTFIGWDSGEHANIPVAIGLVLSALQGAVWTPIWLALRRLDARKRRMTFGVGVPLCLGGSLSLLAATQNSATPYTRLAWAGLTYLLIATLVVWGTRRQATDRSIAGQR
jgi:integrase-like protein